MRINTNVSAINAYRNLSLTQNAVSDSMGKLSSGFRINRAGDDAAGLGIANRLRADTRALSQASKNAEQANSVLQIAEGATSTIQKMLERMKELATQAGSDSVDAAGRTRIQEEFSALQSEITRTVETTKFQGGHLLKTVAAAPATPPTAGTPAVPASTHSDEALTVGSGTANDSTVNADGTYTGTGTTLTVRRNAAGDGWEASADGSTFASVSDGDTVAGLTLTIVDGSTAAVANTTFTLAVTAAVAEVLADPGSPATEASGGDRSFLIGSSEQYTSHDTITVQGLDLTLETLGIDGDDLGTLAGARTALTNIDAAMETLNTTLGSIGAAQNRIAYAQENLKTSIQNFSAAESTIRDLDMAEEMTKFSKNNILAQAGTAMLAQANQSAQGVLQLLQG